MHFKDEILDTLANTVNTAQFVSFAPGQQQRFCRIQNVTPNHRFSTLRDALDCLLRASNDRRINLRSFKPDQPQSCEFIYGIRELDVACREACRLLATGLYVIANETIDLNDGGVSGVLHNNFVEFAPGVSPRFVENPDETVEVLSVQEAQQLFQTVYGFDSLTEFPEDVRVEFSIHPRRCGYSRDHVIIWEKQRVPEKIFRESVYQWPTRFSKLLGDKVYGLLLADLLGFPVPRTTAFPRNEKLQPFTFGQPTGVPNQWTRTCPKTQEPGKYSTLRCWTDPYALMQEEDPSGEVLCSCVVQQEIAAHYAGACLQNTDTCIIEGIQGFGDVFMSGEQLPTDLPADVHARVQKLWMQLTSRFGPVRFEWVFDGFQVWVVQLHVGLSASTETVIYPGEAATYLTFRVQDGIEKLRELLKPLDPATGIVVKGRLGLTSHIADLLRKQRVPSKLVREDQE